ncbi:MAG: HEPN domain-containing protein, partial [Pseudomonas fluorescens]
MLYFQDTFSAEGAWWLPETPDHRVSGTLSFDPDVGVSLALSGMLRQLADAFADAAEEDVTIHGITNKGQLISLFECLNQSRTLNFPGFGTETYHANVAAAGLHFSNSDEPLFLKSYFRFDGIEKWLGEKPFDSGFDFDTRIMSITSRTSNEELLVTAVDQELSISTTMRTQPKSDIEIALISEITLVATPHEPKSLNWHMDNAWKIQRLASLCMGCHLPSQTLRLKGPVERVGQNRERAVTVDVLTSMMFPSGNRRSGDLPVISARELISACSDALTNWLDQFDTLGAVLNLLTTVVADKSMFVNVRFLLAIQALEAFHRTIQPRPLMDEADHNALQAALVSAIPASTSKEMTEKLRTTLRFTNEPSLR